MSHKPNMDVPTQGTVVIVNNEDNRHLPTQGTVVIVNNEDNRYVRTLRALGPSFPLRSPNLNRI